MLKPRGEGETCLYQCLTNACNTVAYVCKTNLGKTFMQLPNIPRQTKQPILADCSPIQIYGPRTPFFKPLLLQRLDSHQGMRAPATDLKSHLMHMLHNFTQSLQSLQPFFCDLIIVLQRSCAAGKEGRVHWRSD